MNLPLPPRLVRRLVIGPLMVVVTAGLLAVTPLVLLAVSFAIRFLPGRWRPVRLFWFLLVYLVRESVGLFALWFLWIASGFGRFISSAHLQRAHVALAGWYLRGLVGSASKVMGLRLVTEAVPDDLAVRPGSRGRDATDENPPQPVLVFARHAGAGDSLILVHLLVNTYRRIPHIVLKDMLQLDPCIDLVLNRVPSRFIGPGGTTGRGSVGNTDVLGSIRELAAELEDDGALILFPEGGNFSEGRRTRAIERLAEAGFYDMVALAHELTYVLPPRPGGAFAAIDAAPEAEVLFVAHTGLEQLSGLRDLWRGLPMDRDVRLTWWRVHRGEIPDDPHERTIWLYEWWERIDTWIEERRDPDRPATPLVHPEPDDPPR